MIVTSKRSGLDDNDQEPTPKISWKGVCLIFLMPALGGFLFGYDIGATSFVLHILIRQGETHSSRSDDFSSVVMEDDTTMSGNLSITTHHHHHHHHSHQYNDVISNSSAFAIPSLQQTSEALPLCWWHNLKHRRLEQGFLIGAVSAGALLGSHLVLFHLSSWIGRRMELRIAACLYIIGCFCNVLSGTFWATEARLGWWALVVGRLLFGVGVGFVMHGAPTYMAEMAPTSIRGAIVSAKEAVIVLGIVSGYAIGDIVSVIDAAAAAKLTHYQPQQHYHWTHLYMISGCLAVPMLLLTFVVPRSKRWLLMHDLQDEAKEAMNFIYTHNDEPSKKLIDQEFRRLVTTTHANRLRTLPSTPASMMTTSSASTIFQALFESRLWTDARLRPALQAASGLIFFQQLSGQPSLLSYTTVLFNAAGWSGHASVATAILMLCVSSTTVLLVDRFGRKRLLYVCCSVMIISLLVLTAAFWNWKKNGEQALGTEKMLILIAMFSYIGGYQLGFGPITWLLLSEIFPQDVRGPATALGVEFNYLLNFLVQFAVPLVEDRVGWGPTFLLFASLLISALLFIKRVVPETAGMSLEEIEAHMTQRIAEHPSDFYHNQERILEKSSKAADEETNLLLQKSYSSCTKQDEQDV